MPKWPGDTCRAWGQHWKWQLVESGWWFHGPWRCLVATAHCSVLHPTCPALFLQAQKHLYNFEATHCTPLPAQNFQMPWHL